MTKFADAVREASLFDAAWYLRRNPDVEAARVDPFRHYVDYGRLENRSPGPMFDADWYLGSYAHYLGSLDACTHYLTVGRTIGLEPLPPHSRNIGTLSKSVAEDLRKAANAKKLADPSYLSKGIIIRTYEKDAQRLWYALSSIKKFARGFDSVTVICQEIAQDVIEPVVNQFDFAINKICPSYPNDYIGQQITKLRAHEFVDADIIFHLDSDCMFSGLTDLSHYIRERKPILQNRTYDELYRQGVYIPWQEPTSRLLRRQVDREFMCGFPFVYPRQLTIDLEKHFISINKFTYEELEENIYIKNVFSEYNLIGAFSFFSGNKYNYHQLESVPFDLRVNQHCRLGDRNVRIIDEVERKLMEKLLLD